MNLWLAGLITVGVAALAIGVMFLVRRGAPVGGYFSDSDRAAGVFGVLGTAFAVLLAFVIFLAFESYGSAKKEADQEAIAVMELYNVAAVFPAPAREELRAQVLCYSQSVVYDEWRAMRNEKHSTITQRWVDGLEADIASLDVAGDKESTAYSHWFSQDAVRQEGRRGRLAEATPVVPAPLWIFLILGGAVAVVYMCFWADSGERFVVQALMIGSVTGMVTASLLVVHFLDRPYENRTGSIKPAEMTRSLHLMEQKQRASGQIRSLCDERGRPL